MKLSFHTHSHLALLDGGNSDNLLIDKYIHLLEKPLLGVIPDLKRESFLEEARVHLEQVARAEMEEGASKLEATETALASYGNAKANAEAFIAAWYECQNQTYLTRRLGRANIVSYTLFQTMVVIYFVILQANVFLPSTEAYHLPWSPAAVRTVWPNPLPFPDFSFKFFLMVGFPIFAPMIAGWLIGRLIPARTTLAVYHGLLPLALVAFIVGALLLPATEGLLFGLFLVFFWLPVGCISAYLSLMLARRSRCRPLTQ